MSNTDSAGDDLEKRIRDRAFELWVEDGRPFGKEEEHWERARAEIARQGGTADDKLAPGGASFGP